MKCNVIFRLFLLATIELALREWCIKGLTSQTAVVSLYVKSAVSTNKDVAKNVMS